MGDENRNEADLINTLVELGLLREYKQLAEILFENKELLLIKDKEGNTLQNILKELKINEIDHIIKVIKEDNNPSHNEDDNQSVVEFNNIELPNDMEVHDDGRSKENMEISIFPKENEINNIEMNSINVNVVERPRFAVSHMLKKRTILEESKDDDYNMFTFVDEVGLKHFKNIFGSFIKHNLQEKGEKIYIQLVNKEQEVIKNDFDNLKQVLHSITPMLKDIYKDKPTNKGCCFNFFNSKKGNKLDNTHDFMKQINSLVNNLESLNCLDEKGMSISKKDKFLLLLNDLVEAKVNTLMKEDKNGNKLKDEVDKYADYFNANKFVEKQRKKLETQKLKMNLCEDSKNLKDCIICMDQERSTLFYPCLHLIVCSGCAEMNVKSECPECHKPIDRKEELSL